MELFWLLIALFLCYMFAGPEVTIAIVISVVILVLFVWHKESKKSNDKERTRLERKLKHCDDDEYYI